MAAQPTDPKDASKKPEKKKTETVLLSADELRRLSGGASTLSDYLHDPRRLNHQQADRAQ